MILSRFFSHNEQGRETYVSRPCSLSMVPLINKSKHALQRVFPALFALFALACASKPASQKPKITRKSIAGRCFAVLPEQKCVQTRKGPQRILAVLSRGLTQYGRISARQNRVCPCRSMVRSLYHIFRRGTTVLWKVMPGRFSAGGRKLSGKKRISASFLV